MPEENKYEIRTEDPGYGHHYIKLVPYCNGKPIAAGKYISIYGYKHAVREARKAIRLHRKYGVI